MTTILKPMQPAARTRTSALNYLAAEYGGG